MLNPLSVASSGGSGGLTGSKRTKGPISDDGDVRDQIGILVGGNYKALYDETSQLAFQRIATILGPKKAQGLVSHIIIQNQRPDFQKMQPAERVQRFYDIPSSVPANNDILQRMKGISTGVLPGYQQSTYLPAQRQQGISGEGIIGKIADYTKK